MATPLLREQPCTEDETPGWWPYAAEFPYWHVWRGVAGLLYARRPRSSPPMVVRATTAAGLARAVAARENGAPLIDVTEHR